MGDLKSMLSEATATRDEIQTRLTAAAQAGDKKALPALRTELNNANEARNKAVKAYNAGEDEKASAAKADPNKAKSTKETSTEKESLIKEKSDEGDSGDDKSYLASLEPKERSRWKQKYKAYKQAQVAKGSSPEEKREIHASIAPLAEWVDKNR